MFKRSRGVLVYLVGLCSLYMVACGDGSDSDSSDEGAVQAAGGLHCAEDCDDGDSARVSGGSHSGGGARASGGAQAGGEPAGGATAGGAPVGGSAADGGSGPEAGGMMSAGGSVGAGGSPSCPEGSEVQAGSTHCLALHCADGVFQPEQGELEEDCGGECGLCFDCVDEDGDGAFVGCESYTEVDGPDCDDADPELRPGNRELCDGFDNDCDPATSAFEGEEDSDDDGITLCEDCDDADPGVGTCQRSSILMVPDGLGYAQIVAARMFLHGADYESHHFSFEEFASSARVTTASKNSDTTDSAAAASAMATGIKFNNGAVSFDVTDIETVLEQHAQAGKSTGLVTVFDSVVAATPAAFAAHTTSRTDSIGIADDFCRGVSPNVLFGGKLTDLYLNTLLGVNTSCVSPYSQVVSDLDGLMELAPVLDGHYLGEFSDVLSTGSEHDVSLDARTQKALELLEMDPDGFFLMVEHAETDKYGHGNNLLGVIQAVIEFDRMVQGVMAWRAGRDTVTVVMAPDHETGGLIVTDEQPVVGQVPAHLYATGAHTGADLPMYVEGAGAEYVTGVLANTEVYWLLRQGSLSP